MQQRRTQRFSSSSQGGGECFLRQAVSLAGSDALRHGGPASGFFLLMTLVDAAGNRRHRMPVNKQALLCVIIKGYASAGEV